MKLGPLYTQRQAVSPISTRFGQAVHEHKHEHKKGEVCSVDHSKDPSHQHPHPKVFEEKKTGHFISRTFWRFWEWLGALIASPFQDLEWLFRGGHPRKP